MFILILSIVFVGMSIVLSLGWPRYAVILLLFVVGLWPEYIVVVPQEGFPGINPQRILLFIMMITWFIHRLTDRDLRTRLNTIYRENRKLFISIVLYFLWAIVASLFASSETKKSLFSAGNQIIAFPFFMILVLSYFKTKKSLKTLFLVLLIIAIIAEVFGLVEWVYQQNILANYVNPVSEHAEMVLAGNTREGIYRITSTFNNPLSFAEYLVMMMPVGLYLLFNGQSMKIRLVAFMQIILAFPCLYFTQSRASFVLATLIVLLIPLPKLWISIKNPAKWGLALLILSTLVTIASSQSDTILQFIISASTPEEIESTAVRAYQLTEGIPAVMQSPITGYGLLQGVNFVQPLKAIDNYYLSVALETGVTGLFLLILMQSWVLVLSCHLRNPDYPYAHIYFTASFLGLFANELTLSIIQNFAFYYTLVGMVFVIKHIQAPVAKELNNIGT
jgi:hypothetical protein